MLTIWLIDKRRYIVFIYDSLLNLLVKYVLITII